MQLTKGAIGNLINRYKAVLKKCHLLNVFGSLAVAGMLIMGGVGVAVAADYTAANKEEFNKAFEHALQVESASIKVTSPITDGSGIGIFNTKNPTIKNLTIDFNGNKYTFTTLPVGSEGYESQAVHLEKDRTVTLKNGTLDVALGSQGFKMGIQNYCDLTLDNMVVDGTNLLGDGPYTMSNNHGDITINNSTIIAKKGGVAFDVYYWPAGGYGDGVSVTVNNSTINGKIEVTVDGSAALKDGAKHQLTLTGGTLTGDLTAAQGAQLYNEGTTVISNVAMAGNTATDKGGAIFNSDDKTGAKGDLTLNNVDLKGNNANFGGAIWNEGTLTVNGGSFEDNTAKSAAGAIYNAADATLTVDGVTFTNNSSAKAGAINNYDGKVTISDSTFKGNDAGKSMGGAVTNTSGSAPGKSIITITGSTFESNTAGNGGAVWNGTYGKVTITDSTFKDNKALAKDGQGQGGAITNANAMTITGGSFANNTANYSGGAIYNGAHAAPGKASLTIDGTTFTGNSVTATYSKDSTDPKKDNIAGGAIFNDTGAKLDVKNATFTDNTSSLKGGAIFNRDGEVAITNSTFKNNSVPTSAGGAVLNESGDTSKPGTITITGSTFEGNKAGNGGAVWNGFDGTVNITGSTFKGNTAVAGIGQGGAITNADEMTITGSTFEGNQAGKLGGAIFNAANGNLTFNGTNTFTNNTAAGNANDIYNAGTITVADGTTTLNSGLTQVDGEIFVNGGTLDMASGSSLSFDENSTLTIDGGTFVADFDQLLTDYATTNKDNGITDGTSIIGTTGNLNLRLDGGYYTLDEYNNAKATLLGQGEENASLNFLNASLKVDEGQALVVGADKTGNEVTIEMAPVVADANEAPEDAIADGTIPSVPNQIVSVVTNNEDKELLEADTIKVAGGSKFTAKGLEIAGTAGAEAVTLQVISNSDITLTGEGGGFTGVVAEGEAVATAVTVNGATLNMGLAGNSRDQGLTLVEATVETGGTLNANGGVAGTTSEYAINALTMQTNSQVNVLNSTMQIGQFTAAGGTMFVDPAYVKIDSVTSPTFGTKLLVGTGSTVNIGGMSEADMRQAMEKAGMSVGPNFTVGANQSVLVLGQGITLGATGQIVVDANVTSSGTIPGTSAVATAHFGDGSLLVVNGNAINGATAAINLSGATTKTLNVENGAKLFITDAVAGQTYTVITGEANTDTAFNGGAYADAGTTGWKGSNLLTSSDMLTLTSTDGTVFMAKSEDAHTVFPKLSHELATAVNTLYGQKLNDVDADAMGVRFLSRATDNRFLGSDKDAAASTIESAARIAFAGAVPQMTKMASDAGSNAVVNRLGFANPADGAQAMNAEGKIVDRNTTGFALWIAPLWQSQHGWGMEADNLDYGFNGNLGGVSLGADYTFENAIRAGITFNIGGGYAESSGGDLNSTENRMSFWGLGAYAGWNYENFGLMADVSYTSTWNDLKQDMDSRMGMGDLEADVQASAISAGLRAEYKLETSVLDVIPHIGVRYMSLNTWGFDAESNGGTVLEGDGFHQDIWTFPVGVTFTKDFTLDSGWSFKPSIDFSVIPAAGDIKAKQDVAFTGLPGSYEVETQMMDYLTWQGGVGLEMGNDTMSFGVNYTLQAGQHTTGHGVFGSFRYEF